MDYKTMFDLAMEQNDYLLNELEYSEVKVESLERQIRESRDFQEALTSLL
tara:strand:+ start:50 stop:199 length:150 start_codon:yes stop_codon:yes gene_type:complete